MPTYLDVKIECYTSKKMFKRCSNQCKTQLILAQKLVFCCFNLVRLLHYFNASVIIKVPESVVTDTGKNTLTEVARLSIKSSGFYSIFPFLTYKQMEKLIDTMEDDDDVQNVWHNWEQE